MGLIELTIAFISVFVYALARTRLPKQILASDAIFMGVLMFFVGAYDGAYELHYKQGAREVLQISTICLASTAFGSFLLPIAYKDIPSLVAPGRPVHRQVIVPIAWGLILFNLGFSYLVFVKLLNGSWSALSSETGLLGIRKLISTGEKGYFFPGLVKQVRDVLGPAMMFYLLAYTRPKEYRKLTVAVGLSTLFAIFLGGQRMPLLVMAWAVFAGRRWNQVGSHNRASQGTSMSRMLGYVLLSVPALAGINAMLGRMEMGSGMLQVAWNTIYGVFDRLVLIVPLASIESFLYVTAHDIDFAQLWIADLMSLAPGTQTGMSNHLHSYLGGSFAGNVVLGMPVNAYFNAGYIGVVLVPIFAMFAAGAMDRIVGRWQSPYLTSARFALLAYLPICYDPFLFLLNGGLFFLAVWGAVRLFCSSKRDSRPENLLDRFPSRGGLRFEGNGRP